MVTELFHLAKESSQTQPVKGWPEFVKASLLPFSHTKILNYEAVFQQRVYLFVWLKVYPAIMGENMCYPPSSCIPGRLILAKVRLLKVLWGS
jgi:hypothetical protein